MCFFFPFLSLGWHGEPAGDQRGGETGGSVRVPLAFVRQGDRVAAGKSFFSGSMCFNVFERFVSKLMRALSSSSFTYLIHGVALNIMPLMCLVKWHMHVLCVCVRPCVGTALPPGSHNGMKSDAIPAVKVYLSRVRHIAAPHMIRHSSVSPFITRKIVIDPVGRSNADTGPHTRSCVLGWGWGDYSCTYCMNSKWEGIDFNNVARWSER